MPKQWPHPDWPERKNDGVLRGRQCVAGDPVASKASLAEAARGALTIERVGRDRYGRTLALVAGAKGDLSCWQVRRGRAAYVARWDTGNRIADRCGAAELGQSTQLKVKI